MWLEINKGMEQGETVIKRQGTEQILMPENVRT